MRISDLSIKSFGLAALCALAACAGSGRPAPKAVNVTVGGTTLILAAAKSLCVDPTSVRSNTKGTFALLDDCVALGPVKQTKVTPANNGLITVSISPGAITGAGESPKQGLESLRDFLAGPGRPALARSGQRDGVTIVSSSIENDMLLLQVRDTGPVPVPKLSRTFWRGYKEVKGQTVSASLSTFVARGAQAKGRVLLKDVLAEIAEANVQEEKTQTTPPKEPIIVKLPQEDVATDPAKPDEESTG